MQRRPTTTEGFQRRAAAHASSYGAVSILIVEYRHSYSVQDSRLPSSMKTSICRDGRPTACERSAPEAAILPLSHKLFATSLDLTCFNNSDNATASMGVVESARSQHTLPERCAWLKNGWLGPRSAKHVRSFLTNLNHATVTPVSMAVAIRSALDTIEARRIISWHDASQDIKIGLAAGLCRLSSRLVSM